MGVLIFFFVGFFWRGVRVVEGARLESVYTRKGIAGSNPALSAIDLRSFSEGGFPNLHLMQFVYILKCSDNTYYTGCTQTIEDRCYQRINLL
jgi:hypothetical protein